MLSADTTAAPATRVLIAGFGSLLHGDDGFGVAVVARLQDSLVPRAGVELADIGTGGIHLVHRLLDGYDALLIVDTVRRGGQPGTLYLLEPEVEDLHAWSDADRRAYCADMHYTEPSRALVLAKALNVLPQRTMILGCEPAVCDAVEIGLSAAVQRAVEGAAERIARLLVAWDHAAITRGA